LGSLETAGKFVDDEAKLAYSDPKRTFSISVSSGFYHITVQTVAKNSKTFESE
jgi:hypothetical protein